MQVTAAVVTCGGLCPGLNDVIQNIVFTLEDYGVPPDQIFGIRYGLRGFYDREFKPINLNKRVVQNIHLQGGTMLVSFYTPVVFSSAARGSASFDHSGSSSHSEGSIWDRLSLTS
jgi:6-phosphofructokinase